MSKTSNDLLRSKTVRGKDLEGKTHTLVKTLPQQLQLFQTFLPDDDERYSNTIELYDPRSRGLSEHGAFSCEERCIPAHMQGWGYQLEEDVGTKCQRWVVTRDSA